MFSWFFQLSSERHVFNVLRCAANLLNQPKIIPDEEKEDWENERLLFYFDVNYRESLCFNPL